MTASELEYAAFAASLADTARDIALTYWRTNVDTRIKADASPVSIADESIEVALRARINAAFPTHGIIGEENANTQINAQWCWVIDPIDGTKAFISGLHHWGIMIALLKDGVPVVGVIDVPALDERYVGIEGQVTTCNQIPITTSQTTALAEAKTYTTSPDYFSGEAAKALDRVRESSQFLAYGGDCYLSAALARGTIDGVIETGLNPYDILAAVPIIKGAGGEISTWNGEELTLLNATEVIASANLELHKEMLELIAR